jgi:ABC-2 type transport system ATP-binding protein
MIETRGLTKRYGARVAVDDVSLQVRSGEIYGFLGPNGAGKTTTILMLLGILQPDAGEARIAGQPVGRNNLAARRLVGAVSENQYLYDDVTVEEYLRFFARFYRVEQPGRRIAELLEEVGLTARAGDRAVHLSRGLQQKLGLARALLHDPPVLILDEPVSGLDPHGIREVREIIVRERGRGRCIFLSSHVLSEVERTADRVGILRAGRLLVEDATGRVREQLTDRRLVEVDLDGPAEPFLPAVRALPVVREATAANGTLRLELAPGADARRDLSLALTAAGGVIVGMREPRVSLEDAFVTLTDDRIGTLVSEAD